MSKHTPGPWKVVKARYDNGAVAIGVDAGTKHWVARIPEDTENGIEREESNARLIAAAPELLSALREVWAQMDTSHLTDATIVKIKAAIAKAEGSYL